MNTTDFRLDEIKPYAKNPRKNDAAVDAVAASIKEFGFQQPLVIDKNHVIVVGHTRYKAAKKLGLESVPCVIADELTEEQINAYRLADNKTNELAAWDGELLAAELGSIENIDMSLFGFTVIEDVSQEKEPIDISDSVNDVYQIVIECESEIEQEECFYNLTKEGYKCRVLTL